MQRENTHLHDLKQTRRFWAKWNAQQRCCSGLSTHQGRARELWSLCSSKGTTTWFEDCISYYPDGSISSEVKKCQTTYLTSAGVQLCVKIVYCLGLVKEDSWCKESPSGRYTGASSAILSGNWMSYHHRGHKREWNLQGHQPNKMRSFRTWNTSFRTSKDLQSATLVMKQISSQMMFTKRSLLSS